MADDSRAEPHRPVLAARAHRCRPIDELGFSDGLHFSRAVGAVGRPAVMALAERADRQVGAPDGWRVELM
jgi:hypothetical protein